MVFGSVVTKIFFSRGPLELELELFNSVFDPVETHINGFGAFLFECAVDDAVGSAVVSAYGCRWLGMAHFDESSSDGYGLLSIKVNSGDFGFGGRCHDVLDDFCKDEDRAIEEGTGMVGQIVETASTTARFWADEVCGVTINSEDHVTGAVDDFGVRVAGSIVEETVNGSLGFGSAVGHSGGNVVHGVEHGGVDGTGIVEEFSDDPLDVKDLFGGERWGVIIMNQLGADGLGGDVGRAGTVLIGECMFEFFESLLDVSGHVATEFAAGVVPVQVDADILFNSDVDFEGIFLSHNGG